MEQILPMNPGTQRQVKSSAPVPVLIKLVDNIRNFKSKH